MGARADTPNILLIMTDQHSRHVLGCYGNRIVRTPNLDRLATAGMRFTNAYCPAPLCVPSRMSFLTARTPSANAVWDNLHILHSGIPTWATLLSIAGYETALLGRMHFCGPDQRHGFESRPVGELGAGDVGIPARGGPLWTQYPNATAGQCRESVELAGLGHTHYQWSDEERTRVAIRWLTERAAAAPAARPFAAVLGYVLPHCPFIARPDLFDYYYPRVDIPPAETSQPATIRRFRTDRGILEPPLPEERVRVARAAYFGLCEHVDGLIGQVLDTLDRTGLARNTLVLYVSDHGEMAGEHGCWWKSNYYEASAGVPMIARWPGVVAPGSVCPAVCNLLDLGPTLAEVAGTAFPYPVEGRSLVRTLRETRDPDWTDETFSELVDARGYLPSRMIRSGDWKLWLFADDRRLPPALFNLRDDPMELNDLGADPSHADVRETLLERLHCGWDPARAAAESRVQRDAFGLLARWGRTVRPDAPDNMVFPPADYEADVVLR